MLIGRAVGRGAFKGAALIGAFVIIIAAWWWDASLLTAAADENLRLIKTVTGALPFNWGSKAKARCASSAPIAPSCSSRASPLPKSPCSEPLTFSAAAVNRCCKFRTGLAA